jgi:prefoldin subunit 5
MISDLVERLRDRIEELESEQSKAMGHTLALATTLHRNFYKTQAPNWEPLEDVVGVITQIDNMIIGVADRIEELEAVLQEVDAWVEDLGYYADDGAVLVPVFKKVKSVLGKGYT